MSATADLTARVAALEQQLAELRQPDQLTPNVLTYDGQQVGADFTGLVNALGLIIPAYNVSPGTQNQVVWETQPGGAIVASITADVSGALYLKSVAPTPNTAVQAQLATVDSALSVRDRGPSVPAQILAFAGSQDVNVFDENGASSFVQLPGQTRKAILSWGTVVSGSGVFDAGSGDWSVLGTATGATQISLGSTRCIGVCSIGAGRILSGANNTCQMSNGVNPVISAWSSGALTTGIGVSFIALHD